jgi:hypothetical protein
MKLNAQQYAAAQSLGIKSHLYHGDHDKLSRFGEACFNSNSFDDLKDFQTATPCDTDMANWNIDADAWRQGQEEAIEQAMSDYEDEIEAR